MLRCCSIRFWWRHQRKKRRTTYLSREAAEERKPKVAEREGKVLVEKVAQEFGHAQVGPAAVDQQQPLQVAKLGNTVIGSEHRLQTFLATDADADVGRLDHRHVVGTITDGQRNGLFVLFYQVDDHGLLQRRHPAANHSFAFDDKKSELILARRSAAK